MSKQIINTVHAPAPIGPYNQAVLAGNFLFISGQIAINPENGELMTSSIADETNQVMKNISNILREASMDFSHVVKTSIFLSDMTFFAEVNEIYARFFSDNYPARETVAVKGLPKNVNIEISMIASK
jgi:2-iminobutanoate/2-iminopropanoate deaminase